MGSKKSYLLEVNNLRKSYGQLQAVDDLSFHLEEGEILGVSGPNGAGKTTMFDVISGITLATSGRVIFRDKDITGLGPNDICHRGLARSFQMNAGFDGLTLSQNVMIGATYGQTRLGLRETVFGSRAARKRVTESIEFIGLEDKRDLLVGNANVLERKLTMIASVLATRPKVIMLDEPVGGLVSSEVDLMVGLVQRLREQDITIVLIEHVIRFLTLLSDRILVMHHGARLFEGTADEMMKDPAVVDVYLGKAAVTMVGSETARLV